MKHLSKLFFCVASLFFAVLLFAQNAEIIKQDGQTVYIDISALAQKPKTGSSFSVLIPGQEIINPKTGQNLGKEDGQFIKGRIKTVQEMFATGKIENDIPVMGMQVYFPQKDNKQPDKVKSDMFLDAEFPQEGGVKPLWLIALKEQAKAIAVCDINGDGEEEIIPAGLNNNTLSVYKFTQDKQLKQLTSYNLAADKTVLALDCAAVKQNENPVLFVSVFDALSQDFYTYPFTLDGNSLKTGKIFEGVVQGISPHNRPRVLYTQKLLKHGKDIILSLPAKLNCPKDKCKSGKELKIPGLKSIFGFNMADLQGEGTINAIYLTKNGQLKTQFKKAEDFVISSSREALSYSPQTFELNGKIQHFYLPLGSTSSGKNAVITAIRNNKKLQNAQFIFFKWTGDNFAKYKISLIPGIVYDMKQTHLNPFDDTFVIIYNKDGKSTLAVYEAANI